MATKILNKIYLILALGMAMPAGLQAYALTKALANAGSKISSKLSPKFNKLAECFTPRHIALVARAEFKRPSFWLGLAGFAALGYADKLKREVVRLGANSFDINDYAGKSQAKRLAMHAQGEQNDYKLSQTKLQKTAYMNRGWCFLLFAAIARYKGY